MVPILPVAARTSNKVMSAGPVMFHTTPVAFSMPMSSKGEEIALTAACRRAQGVAAAGSDIVGTVKDVAWVELAGALRTCAQQQLGLLNSGWQPWAKRAAGLPIRAAKPGPSHLLSALRAACDALAHE